MVFAPYNIEKMSKIQLYRAVRQFYSVPNFVRNNPELEMGFENSTFKTAEF